MRTDDHGIVLRRIVTVYIRSVRTRVVTPGLIALAAAGLLGACSREAPRVPGSAPAGAAAGERISAWEPLFVGVERCEASSGSPRPQQVRAVRIDLREPTIDFLVTPSNGDEPMDCGVRTTSEFLSEFGCQAAINGSAFAPAAGKRGDPTDVKGVSLSRGDLYSGPNQYDALLIGKDRTVWLDRAPVDATGAYNGLSGFYALLIDGRNSGNDKQPHPRSAAGISRDKRYLILMTIDGRQRGYSEGATTHEAGEWMRKLGAHDALNLDGGGSTALVIEGSGGEPEVLNRPSGIYERRVANHLGVFARPLRVPR